MLIDSVPVFYTDVAGKMFVKERNLSLHDYHRFMKWLRWDALTASDTLIQALIEKDIQRLKKHLQTYIKSECDKLQDCAVFMKRDITMQEMTSASYIICYRVFAELSVKEVPE